MKYCYEILLSGSRVSKTAWSDFLRRLKNLVGKLHSFLIKIYVEQQTIHYLLQVDVELPLSVDHPDFMLKLLRTTPAESPKYCYHGVLVNLAEQPPNFFDLYLKFKTKGQKLHDLEIIFGPLQTKVYLHYQKGKKLYSQRVYVTAVELLATNLDDAKLYYQKIPKYLDLKKLQPLLHADDQQHLLEIDLAPTLSQIQYLTSADYEFFQHSLVIGGSGSGKSRFLALLIKNIYMHQAKNMRIVVIDPHDALQDDLNEIRDRKIIDFITKSSSIDLFASTESSTGVYVELMLSLFQDIFGSRYNHHLERLLRFSIYLLSSCGQFSFVSLRRLILDSDYRGEILRQAEDKTPDNVRIFFMQDFNKLKNQFYDLAFAPLISFIDEMQMIPIFNQTEIPETFVTAISSNFLTIFSLDRSLLGDNVTKTISGLLMQQIFTYAKIKPLDEAIFVIIDEVAIIENPILTRFLSELRKYNIFVVLAGQYFGQLSTALQAAIFANVNNFYCFRTAKVDAELLVSNLQIKLVGGSSNETKALAEKTALLANLKNQECLVQIMYHNALLPTFKARVADFNPPQVKRPRRKFALQEERSVAISEFCFAIDDAVDLKTIMRTTSSSRRRI